MENYGGGSRLTSIERDNASSSALLPQIHPYNNRNEGKSYASTIQPNSGPVKALASERSSYVNLLGKQ